MMPNSDSSKIPSDSLGITLEVSSSIGDITDYYRRATEGLVDDTGKANDPAPEAIVSSLRLGYVRSLVLQHSTQGQEAMLSILWATVKSAQKSFREVTEHFEVKLKEVKALDSRWDKVDTDEIRHSARNSKLKSMCKRLLEARWNIPRVPSVTIPEIIAPSSLGSGTTPWEMFKYAKLDSPKNTIRLVRMESTSASPETPIHITTRTICLEDKVPYATLSYTWGNPFGVFCSEMDRDAAPRTNIPIICDGNLLEIGENLYRFLWRWRQALAKFDEIKRENGMPDEVEESKPPAELWIDAICINQEDLEERNQQVSIMGDIYTNSVTTWVWLGENDQFSREAFSVLQTMNTQCGGAGIDISEKFERDKILARLGLPDMNSWKWFAVFALFQRQWFRRSWVVQEATLSSHIVFQCGSVVVPGGFIIHAIINIRQFDFLSKTISNVGMHEMGSTQFELRMVNHPSKRRAALKRSSKEPPDLRYHPCRDGIVADFTGVIAQVMRIKVLDPDILANDKNSFTNNAVPVDKVSELLDLWKLSRNTLCGNLRDKVYALASLVNRDIYRTPNTVQDRRVLEPDYRKSVCEVYCEAAWFTVLTHASLDLLSMAGHISLDNEHDLPSWVPDLSQSPRFLSLKGHQRENPGIGWLANGGARWEIPPPAMRYGRHLGVQVSVVGKIKDTDHEEPEYTSDEPLKANFRQFLEFSKLLPPTYLSHPEGQSRFEVLWRTVIADLIDGISPASPKYAAEFERLYMEAFGQVFDDMAVGNVDNSDFVGTMTAMWDMGRLQDLSARSSVSQMDIETDETQKFRDRIGATMDKRRLFMADTGHVGCGDSRLSVGDLIVVIAGSSIPFLLRHSSGGRYNLIGEAYVHGIMFGEHAVKPDVEWESITLE
jgi:hypothetical protein